MPLVHERPSGTVHIRDSKRSNSVESLLATVLESMNASWRAGERRPAEDYLAQNPDLAGNTEAAVRVIYEELCLREEDGEAKLSVDVVCRFPQFRSELEVLLGCHRLFQEEPAPARYPEVGEKLGDFELLAELGRGAVGRVFLAREITLADRPVVLKVTMRGGQEHLSLARLQHTHIVPLYTATDDNERNLRILCMPSLGGTTLSALLDALKDIPKEARRGQDLIDTLDRLGAGLPVSFERRGPARSILASSAYSDAVAWIGFWLAEALQYAHERGLVHLDIKPSNVLLAADAQPMLLDFHLAQAPLLPGEVASSIGGTIDYMAAEQREALDAVRIGQPIRRAVDGRSDLYSLGLVLYEALGGQVPTNRDVPLPDLHRCNTRVSVGLSDIIHKMVAIDPERRYPSAGAAAADLRRHLDHLPLRGVPNRSLRERYVKWRRRRPYALALLALAGALVGASTLVGAVVWAKEMDRRRQADIAWNKGNGLMSEGRYADAAQAFGQARSLSAGWLGDAHMHRAFALAEDRATRAQRVQELHVLADHLRFTLAVGEVPAPQCDGLIAVCRKVWQERDQFLTDSAAAPEAALERGLREDFFDLALFFGDLQLRRASDPARARAEAEAMLDEYESRFGPAPALPLERARLRGQAVELARVVVPADATAWDHWSTGRALLSLGHLNAADKHFQAAEALYEAALRKNPLNRQAQDFWATFYRGIAAYRRGQPALAAYAFYGSPKTPECHYFIARAREALGEPDAALEELNRAIEMSPGFAEALVERGKLRTKKEPDAALADLARALQLSADAARVHCAMARVHLGRGDRVNALTAVKQALQANPDHAEAKALKQQLDATDS